MFTTTNHVDASVVLSPRDLNPRPGQDVAEIVGPFLRVGEAVVAFCSTRSIDGYALAQMKQKIREVRLLELAENPCRLAPSGR